MDAFPDKLPQCRKKISYQAGSGGAPRLRTDGLLLCSMKSSLVARAVVLQNPCGIRQQENTVLTRRHMVTSALATTAVLSTPALAKGLDAGDPDIRFGTTGSIFGAWRQGALKMSTDMRMMLADVKHYGLEGFEPYAAQIVPYLGRPQELKALCEQAGVALMDVGDVPPIVGPKPTPGAAAAYPWLGGEGRDKLISRMEAFARDFLQPLGVDHWKNNMGARPPGVS
jgi:hypothetical protein